LYVAFQQTIHKNVLKDSPNFTHWETILCQELNFVLTHYVYGL
jgi:hypothetical protein